jgi:hypothetical protein
LETRITETKETVTRITFDTKDIIRMMGTAGILTPEQEKYAKVFVTVRDEVSYGHDLDSDDFTLRVELRRTDIQDGVLA